VKNSNFISAETWQHIIQKIMVILTM
jgi:hypothetical protein